VVAIGAGNWVALLFAVQHGCLSAAYLFSVGGFLGSYPSPWNGLIAAVWLGVQLRRIVAEEALLMHDTAYQAYARRVPYRLFPGLW